MQLFLMDVAPLEESKFFDHCLSLLSPWRMKKVRALRRAHEQRLSIGAGLLLRHGLATLGCDEEGAGIVADAHGKPRCMSMPHLHFNLSHSGTWVLGGFVKDCVLGVDVEKVAAMDVLAVSEQFFHPLEHALLLQEAPQNRTDLFFRLWTRKESCLKAVGCGLAPVFGLDPASFALLPCDNTLMLGGARWYVRDYALPEEYAQPEGYALSVCANMPHFADRPVVLNIHGVASL